MCSIFADVHPCELAVEPTLDNKPPTSSWLFSWSTKLVAAATKNPPQKMMLLGKFSPEPWNISAGCWYEFTPQPVLPRLAKHSIRWEFHQIGIVMVTDGWWMLKRFVLARLDHKICSLDFYKCWTWHGLTWFWLFNIFNVYIYLGKL